MTTSEHTAATERDAEQRVVDTLYERVDAMRTDAEHRLAEVRKSGPSGSPQNRSERDAFASLYEDRIAQLDAVEDRLCFGRLDMADGKRRYVGRIGVSDADHVPLLTDWRAPAAQAFYSATAANPQGVAGRRHLTTVGRTVTAIEDDVLDVEALTRLGIDTQLAGEGALLAALAARRTGRMGDIVATIQAEQDAVIRAPLHGALVVQGGPGTGKTAVALHRAAFLLYHHRDVLESSGVLLIGPSTRFLRYIDHVLPSLGETGAVSTTLAGLLPGINVSTDDSDAVAAIKGRADMAGVIATAVRERQRLPRTDQHITIDGKEVVIRRRDIKEAQAKARREGKPHHQAREVFAKEMVARLATQLMEQADFTFGEEDRAGFERDVRDSREVRRAVNLAWMPIVPQRLVADLFSQPHILEHAAASLTARERTALMRDRDAPFTTADIPLLDEAAYLLGSGPGEQRPAPDTDPTPEELAYAKEVLTTFGGKGMLSASDLARRMAVTTARRTVAERAAADSAWTYGHVVVDEAQELSPMAWRMLMRRCPTRSFTIVGDVAQTTASAGTRWWPEVMDPSFGSSWQLRELTISYRIPAAVAQVANAYAVAAGLPVSDMRAAREVEGAVNVVQAADPLSHAVTRAMHHLERLSSSGGGTVAIIVPDGSTVPEVDGQVTIVTARAAKGLEFDAVMVVEPAEIAPHPSDLYVALTRCTTYLEVIHHQPLPPGLEAPTATH